jgi:hypothetical protein
MSGHFRKTKKEQGELSHVRRGSMQLRTGVINVQLHTQSPISADISSGNWISYLLNSPSALRDILSEKLSVKEKTTEKWQLR